MGKGRAPIIQPAFENLYGSEWEDKIKTEYADLTKEDAHKKFLNETGVKVSEGAIYGFFNNKVDGFSFKSSSTGKRGKKSTILPLLLNHYKTEDALKEALGNYAKADNTIKEIAEIVNSEAGTEISDPNIYNLLKKYDIVLSRKRKAKSEDLPVGVDVKENMTPVKFTCQTPSCTGTTGYKIDLELGLGLQGRRCHKCNKFGTYKAEYKENDVIKTFSVKE